MLLRNVFITVLICLFSSAALAELETIDQIVAVVNDDVITSNELDSRLETIKEQMEEKNMAIPSDDLIRPQVLDRVIEQMLALQAAERHGLIVDDAALNNAVANIARNNKTTVSGLREMLEKDGIDYTIFLEDLRNQVTVQRAEQAFVGGKVNLSQEEINHLYTQITKSNDQNKQYRLGHILVSLPKDPSAEQLAAATQKAQAAQANLEQAGSDFFDVALKYSESKDVLNQSDLGLRKRAELPTIFSDVTDGMKAGDVRGPIRSSSGLHVIKLLEVQQDNVMPEGSESALKARIQEQLFQRKFGEALQNWYTQLKDEASITVLDLISQTPPHSDSPPEDQG